jgi:hypothetical protein
MEKDYLGTAIDCEAGLSQRPEKSIENRGAQQISGRTKAQGTKSLAGTLQCALRHKAPNLLQERFSALKEYNTEQGSSEENLRCGPNKNQ